MGRPRRYAPEVRERAVRLVAEHARRHDSQWAAIRSVAEKIGCSSETLRHWVRQVERQVGNVWSQLDPNLIMKGLDKVYDLAVEGVEDSPILKSAREIGDQYSASHGSLDQRARRLVRWQVTKAGTSGFLSGLGGAITMPVVIPANMASVMYVQIRMIAAIAHLGGHDVRHDQVRTLCYACMCGSATGEVVKGTGIKLTAKLTEEAIKRLPGAALKEINKKVGFRLATKFGEKGIINLGKMVPITGGVVGGTFDASSTYAIGKIARTVFIGAEQGV